MLTSITKAYQYLIFFGNLLKSPLLLLCRLYWGWLFLQAGLNKLQDPAAFADTLINYHFPLPYFQAYLVGYTELIGGLFLMIGFASRLIAIPLIIILLTAYATVHVDALKALFYQPSLFVAESPFNFLLIAFLVLAFGPGRFSVDYFLERWLFHRSQPFSKHQHLK